MQIAYGAARKSPELQMNRPFQIGHPNALGMDRQKLTPLYDGTGWYMRHWRHPPTSTLLSILFADEHLFTQAMRCSALQVGFETNSASLFHNGPNQAELFQKSGGVM